ncbi:MULTISPECIES: cyclic peptide export ABC transporter [unclassified Pseudoalteromonas]|uniref:cyclic peptide export ABC transporter n=1 Tax=unclassified Pseudoalteromonas TaxID=194690 RepID=UPI0004239954|nr:MULTISPECIES: cyclic peptide export ABC transporter [unclassified Pseudoalteromonas]PCC14218.1 cyclic peptide transporter [Pseudoalteromonas sp. JB197]SJN16329.1 ABC transporter ATP-binding protein [Pseudoalteromonas sp. JB197]
MKLFDAFTKAAPNVVFFSVLLGAFSGILYSLLIPVVMLGLTSEQGGLDPVSAQARTFLSFEVAQYHIAALFLGVCILILLARSASQIMLVRLATNVTAQLRKRLYYRVLKAPVASVERVGQAKIIATITTDIARIVIGARVLPDMLINLVTVMGMLGFLLYLNADVFVLVIGAIVFGVVTYQIPMFFGNRYFSRARQYVDDLHESIQGLLMGVKELKLDKEKRQNFLDKNLLLNEEQVLEADKKGNTIIRAAVNYGDLISFYVIGVTTFIFVNYHSIEQAELIGVVMALLYITGPVAFVINSLPQIALARISLNKVNGILESLPEERAKEAACAIPTWQSIQFHNVFYRHESDNHEFVIGPINLELNRSEITFITGGNGSGKSTLGKVISLHYAKNSGEIIFGDTRVSDATLNACRHEISAIFTDFYLFDRILMELDEAKQTVITEYLKDLQLDEKITVTNTGFSTTALSDGQRKRLALVLSFIEDKPLYIFDEWAADQDPIFKEIFYHNILPDLRNKGKAVVVISHDDRYFSVADKLIVMENGNIIDVKYNDMSSTTMPPSGGLAKTAGQSSLDLLD